MSYATLAYLCWKMEKGQRTLLFEKLRAITIATPVNERIIDQALVSDFDDLEDAMQYFSAVGAKVDVVLTRNYCCPVKLKRAQKSSPRPCKTGLRVLFFKSKPP